MANLVVFALLTTAAVADEVVPLVKTRTDTYKNVTLVSHNATHVFVQHSRGMATLKLADLDKEVLIGLGVLKPEPVLEEGASQTVPEVASLAALQQSFKESMQGNPPQLESLQSIHFNELPPEFKQILLIACGVMFLLHLFFSYCSMLICKKVGMEPGIVVWLPVFQAIPLIKAAGMSGWWFLGCFVPVLNIIVQIMWCVNIAKARGKGVFTTLMLILPITNLLAFLYLAFSGGTAEIDDASGPIRFEPLPA